jgi:hypothetical protein
MLASSDVDFAINIGQRLSIGSLFLWKYVYKGRERNGAPPLAGLKKQTEMWR